MMICLQNLLYTQELQKIARNKEVKPSKYNPHKKV